MKKLVVVASLALACACNAGSFIWGFASGYYEDANGGVDESLGVYAGGTAFLYLGTVAASDTGFSGGTLVTSSGFDDTFYAYGNINTESLTESDKITSIDAGQAYSLILVEGNVASLDGYKGNYVLINGTSGEPGSMPAIPSPIVYGDFMDVNTMITADSWKSMGGEPGPTPGVPEPTSGLLLVVGGAMLALRRKQK